MSEPCLVGRDGAFRAAILQGSGTRQLLPGSLAAAGRRRRRRGRWQPGRALGGCGAGGGWGRTPRICRPMDGGWNFLLASDKRAVTSPARGKTPRCVVSVS